VLTTRVQDVEPVSVQIEITDHRVAHVEDTHPIPDIRTCPELPESLTGGG
jgi:hypothetical protein